MIIDALKYNSYLLNTFRFKKTTSCKEINQDIAEILNCLILEKSKKNRTINNNERSLII